MGNMEVTKEEMLALAIKCIGNQETGCCKKMDCSKCPYNISLDTKDPKIVMSLMARAKMIWPNTKEAQDRNSLHTMLFIIVIVVMWIIGAWAFGEEPAILPMLLEAQKNVRDVNGDGKINCTDYSIVFHEHMPGSFLLVLKNGNINHMFVGIKVKPVLKNYLYWYRDLLWVEPQATTEKYLMKDVWGKEKYWNDIMVREATKYYKYAIYKQWEWIDDNKTKWRWKK